VFTDRVAESVNRSEVATLSLGIRQKRSKPRNSTSVEHYVMGRAVLATCGGLGRTDRISVANWGTVAFRHSQNNRKAALGR
jgi:hypothetical protein